MAKRVREVPEIAAAVRRLVVALGRRIGAGDPVDLIELIRLRQVIDQALQDAVTRQREMFSWAEIAAELNMSRQGAQQRFGRPERRQGHLDTKSTNNTSLDPATHAGSVAS